MLDEDNQDYLRRIRRLEARLSALESLFTAHQLADVSVLNALEGVRSGVTNMEQKVMSLEKTLRRALSLKVKEEHPQLAEDLDTLNLSTRVSNCMKAENIHTIAELIGNSEREISRMPNLGRRSLNEVKEQLAKLGLNLRRPEC